MNFKKIYTSNLKKIIIYIMKLAMNGAIDDDSSTIHLGLSFRFVLIFI